MRIQENLEKQNMKQMAKLVYKEQPFLIIQFVKIISLQMKKIIQSHPSLVMPILEVMYKTILNDLFIFIYNGGPGCASLWLHMGLFGPRIVKLDDELNPSYCSSF